MATDIITAVFNNTMAGTWFVHIMQPNLAQMLENTEGERREEGNSYTGASGHRLSASATFLSSGIPFT